MGCGGTLDQSQKPTESPLRQYLQILKRQAWLVLLVFALTLGVATALLSAQDPIYRASMTLVVGEPRGDMPPVLGSSSVTRTMTNLLESDYVARTVIERLKLDTSTEMFREKLAVEVLPDTAVVDVSYDSTEPRLALGVVTELATIFTRQVEQTLGLRGNRRAAALPGGSFSLIVRTFDAPHVEAEPIGPKKGTTLIVSGVVGIVLGLMLGVAREALDSRIRGQKDAETWFGAPVVGALPRGLRRRPPPGVGAGTRARREDRRVASLDLLRARLQFELGLAGPTIVVTSAGFEEGKTSVTANLAAALARSGKNVIAVDADVGRPGLHRYLAVEQETPGLVDVLEGSAELDEALVDVPVTNPSSNGAGPAPVTGSLRLLPAGSPPASVVGVLTPDAVSGVVDRLREQADCVVVEAPPLLVADALSLASRSDNVLVVARQGRTTRDQAESVRHTLGGLRVERVGVVLTGAPAQDTSASYYGSRSRKQR